MRSIHRTRGSGNVLLGLLIAAAILGLLTVAALQRGPWAHDEEAYAAQVREALEEAGAAAREGVPAPAKPGAGSPQRSTEVDLGWDGPTEQGESADGRVMARDENGVFVVRHLPPPTPVAGVLPVRVHLDPDGAVFVLVPGGVLQPSSEQPAANTNFLEIALAADRRFYTLPDGRLDLELPPSLAERAFEEHVGRGHVRVQVLRPGRLFFAEPGP